MRDNAPGAATPPSERRPGDLPWCFAPVARYKLPAGPAGQTASKLWSRLKNVLRPVDDEAAPARQEDDLRALQEVRLAHLVGPVDWREALDPLEAALGDPDGVGGLGEGAVRFVIGPPYGGHVAVLEHWAERHGARRIAGPSPAQILAGDDSWLETGPGPGQPWMLPRLEHCYLRHAGGLQLLRGLLERVDTGRAGRGLIGCDSWAWAYIQRLWPLPRPEALALQAFDGDALRHLFARLTEGKARLRFRHARSGADVLRVPVAEDKEPNPEFIRLAAHCRGNIGLAREYWRQRLRAEPETEEAAAGDVETASESAREGPGGEAGAVDQPEPVSATVWVSAVLGEPTLPSETDEDIAFVLHALLLHGGLQAELLPGLLPLPAHRITAIVRRLEALHVLQFADGRWRIAPLAYVVVRQLLQQRDFLTDDF